MEDREIYPTVMADGHLYERRKGAAIRSELPNDRVTYGELTHVAGETPTNDGEIVSAFSVSGQIYTSSENDTCVYLCLTTDWLNKTVAVFDLVAHRNSQTDKFQFVELFNPSNPPAPTNPQPQGCGLVFSLLACLFLLCYIEFIHSNEE